MVEQSCIQRPSESLLLGSEKIFLVSFGPQINKDDCTYLTSFLGAIGNTPDGENILEIPFSSNTDRQIGAKATMIRQNNEILSHIGITMEEFKKYIGGIYGSPKFIVTCDENNVRIQQSLNTSKSCPMHEDTCTSEIISACRFIASLTAVRNEYLSVNFESVGL
jgi:hypothetical protein